MTAKPGLYRLLAWLSPNFPIGAFGYSHGLEAAFADGAISDAASLQAWIASNVARGSGRIDADILVAAYRAAQHGDFAALDAANRRGLAFRPTAELALESGQQGAAFLAAYDAVWAGPPSPSMGEPPDGRPPRAGVPGVGGGDAAAEPKPERSPPPHPSPIEGQGVDRGDGEICHSAVFGAVAARAGIALDHALVGYLAAFAGNLVSAGLRLGIIGQTAGQRILAALEPVVAEAASAATVRKPGDFGAATFAADLASMAHESQHVRLFRS